MSNQRLIYAERVKAYIRDRITYFVADGETDAANYWRDFIDVIDESPTADAEPAVHGEWQESDAIPGMISCSRCGAQRNPNFKIGMGEWNFCPNCGAKNRRKGDGRI